MHVLLIPSGRVTCMSGVDPIRLIIPYGHAHTREWVDPIRTRPTRGVRSEAGLYRMILPSGRVTLGKIGVEQEWSRSHPDDTPVRSWSH